MLVPIFISFYLNEYDLFGFIYSSLICFGVGIPLWLLTRNNKSLSNKIGFAVVTFSWVIAALAGALPFYLSGAIPNFTDAFFESMSGVTTTGSSIIGNIETLPHLVSGIESLPYGILFWRSFIQWIGGMGIVVFYIAILPILGSGGIQLFKLEVPGPVADKIKPRLRETAKMLWIVYIGITLANIIALVIVGMPIFDSVCHAFTIMPTGGFSIKNASIAYYDSALIQSTIMFFMFLAGINFTLHYRFINGSPKSYIKDREFLTYFSLIIIISTLIFLSISVSKDYYLLKDFKDALFQTISIITTTGFATSDYELWPVFAQAVLLSLMFIGAMGGSTGGGMKVIRSMVLVKYAGLEARRMLHSRALIPVRIGKQHIDEDVVRNTLGFFLFFISSFAISSMALTLMGVDLLSAIGAAASAMGNIGPGLNSFGPTDNYALLPDAGKWVLSFCMLLGRLEIFTVIVLFSRTFWK
ncbi:MAG: potassium transporter [Flavobacteriaceae bacterium TMED184]|nr:MAG: potassium transporter [Flavobacteriaceae bacterium TMED184]